MFKYLVIAKALITKFKAVKIEQVGKDLNSHVDALVGLALVFEGKIWQTIAVYLTSAPSYKMPQEFVLVNTKLRLSSKDHILNPNYYMSTRD